MRILETRVYRGPNLYAYRPMIRLTVDLGPLEDWPTSRIPGFVDRLLAAVPSLGEHRCGIEVDGGFAIRLREGTWLGHVLEHVALELQTLAGMRVSYGKARSVPGAPGVYHVAYAFEAEEVGLAAGDVARRLLLSLLPEGVPCASGETVDVAAACERLAAIAADVAMGPSTKAIVDEAERRGIPWLRLDDASLVQLGHGCRQKRVAATITSHTSQIAVDIAQDKSLTLRLLHECGLPVPDSACFTDVEEGVAYARRIGFPVVVKPLDLSHGRGVATDLRTEEQVRAAFAECRALAPRVVVERHLPGRDYRLLVVAGEVVAASERVPGHVVGDGVSTVAELVDALNRDPKRGVGHSRMLTRIEIDAQAKRLLALTGKTLDTVLPAGERLYLRATANLSTGGTAVDRTDVVHPDNAEIARRAARIVGLDVAGIDLIAPDIARSVRDTGGGIVEVNAAPGFRMHVLPTEGQPRNVAAPVLDMLFPPGTPTRVPIVAITGTNGKTTTARMVAHILKMSGARVGLTTTDGIYIDGERVIEGDTTGPWSARVILRDPAVEAAVLETARGGILREGLGFRRCDVGAVLNVSEDHLGLGGIETLEDLAFVKRLVLEIVEDQGVSVMNADDPLVVAMAPEARGRPVWFSMDPENPVVRAHLAKGGEALVLENGGREGALTLRRGAQRIRLLRPDQIPATLGGAARFNVANALAAAAIAFGLGVSLEHVRQGLRTFHTTFFQAPGRLNVIERDGVHVVLDYAHNPAAMRAVVDLARRLPRQGRTIAVVGAAGDRRDVDIRALGRIAGEGFDRVICREDVDRRGRRPGEAPELLREGCLEGGMDAARVAIVPDEREAIQQALHEARPGDVVLVFAEHPAEAWRTLEALRVPTPA